MPKNVVVIGGSMAGLLAARVLADRSGKVTILDRDRLPDQAGFRAGVPQSRHAHALLLKGLEILQELFPGIKEELLAAGALQITWPRDVVWMGPSGFAERFVDGLQLLCASRELIEWTIRRRVSALPNVTILDEADVTGPRVEGGACTGVKLGGRTAAGLPAELSADLTIDATGRGSHLPEWLTQLGHPAPRETVIDAFLGYASRFYEEPADAPEWKIAFLQSKPPNFPRGGVVFPIEGKRWHVTLAGYGRDYPPTDEDGFLAYARSLRNPVLYEAIKNAKPVSAIHGHRGTANRRRHYEEMPSWPKGVIAIGDSVCAFNPLYGQGMSVAAMSAVALRETLATADTPGFERRFQKRLAEATDTAWMFATGEDFRYPTTEGGSRPASLRMVHAYLNRLMALGTRNEQIGQTLLRVAHLVSPMTELLTPKMFWRSLVAKQPQELTAPPPPPLTDRSTPR